MGKKSAEMAFTSNQIKSSKWLLLLCAASAAAVDVAIMVLLIIGGMGAAYLVCPIILFAFDVIYFVVSLCFTNFRFRYSMAVWISYLVLYAVGMAIQLLILLGGKGTVISNFALIVWSAVHGFNIVCAIAAALYSSRVLKHIWLGIVFAVIFLLGCGGYITYICTSGFFGQGLSSRPLVFKYDSASGEYTATDVLAGRSKKVIVPATFNGKPVTALSFNVLANGSVKEYSFAADIKFTDGEVLDNELSLEGKSFFVDKEAVNEVRATLYGYAGSGLRSANAVALANATLPTNLSEGEGYVAFTYDANSFAFSKGNVLPVYVGDLSSFDIASYTAGYDYIAKRDSGNTEHLDWAYKNGGYILSDIVSTDGGSVLNGAVTGNTIAELKYDKIYRVTVESGNDEKYDVNEEQAEFCFDTVNGNELTFRYVTSATAADFTAGLEGRKGFNLEWLYYDGVAKKDFTSLSTVLSGLDGSDVTVIPRWELKAPVVNITTTAEGNRITYGEDVTLNSNATIEAEGVQLKYMWAYNAEPEQNAQSTDESWTLTTPRPDVSGEYRLLVLAMGGEVTSLTAQVNASVNVVIDRKPVEFVWTAPNDLVYDGALKTARFDFDESQLVGDDNLQFAMPLDGADDRYISISGNEYSVKYAGTYSPYIMLDGTDAANYDAGNSVNYSFTIEKRHVSVEWSNYDNLVYNAALQGPSASFTGCADDGEIVGEITGKKVNAGENYTATAVLSDEKNISNNYIIDNATQGYSIAKAPLTVTAGSASAVYGSAPDTSAIALSYSGWVGSEDESVLGGSPVFAFAPTLADGAEYKVGTYTEGVAVSGYTASNYEISYVNGELTITQLPVVLRWEGVNNLVYNATEKQVAAVVSNAVTKGGVKDDVSIEIIINKDNKDNVQSAVLDAGDYTAKTTVLSGADSGNYLLENAEEKTFTVSKAQVTITADAQSTVYGQAVITDEELTANSEGIIDDEITFTLSVDWKLESDNADRTYYKAGDYKINVVLNNENDNYDVTITDVKYTVEKKIITANDITWTNYDNSWKNLVYTGTGKEAYANINNGVLIEGDEVTVVVRHEVRRGDMIEPVIDSISVGAHMAVADRLSGDDADNYKLAEGIEKQYTVDAAILNVTWMYNGEKAEDGVKIAYDGEPKAFTVKFENLAAYDLGDFELDDAQYPIEFLRAKITGVTVNEEEGYISFDLITTAVDVKEYNIAFMFKPNISNNYGNVDNSVFVYEIVKGEGELTVYYKDGEIADGGEITLKIGESITWESNTLVTVSVANDVNAVADSEHPELPVPENNYTFSEAGKYTVVITAEGDNNHNEKSITITVTVEDADETEAQPENA